MSLQLADLHKRYGEVQAVAGVSLELARGETLALLGPSGCGKSTLLRLVAGLEPPDAGSVWLDGSEITRVAPQSRGFGVVFQDFALFPHLDVAANIAFALVEQRRLRQEISRRVDELLGLVGLPGLGSRRVHQLSGGQQQRVALARALAHEPRLLLLDEPLSNLDEALRQSLKREIARILSRLGVQAIYVTHDQAEAFSVAASVAVMREGRIVKRGSPEQLLSDPGSAWLARFLGHQNVWQGAAAAALAAVAGVSVGQDGLLLRSELLRPASPGEAGSEADRETSSEPAEVLATERDGLAWRLRLRLPRWQQEVTWQGYIRELERQPAPGMELRLIIPREAWRALDGTG